MPEVVILGGSFAALTTAHKLLKHTLPAVPSLHITLVAPSTHLYWNFAAVRAVVPSVLPDDKIFTDFRPGFEKYGAAFTFVQGLAQAVDIQGKTVTVNTSDNNGGSKALPFDQLVVATGTSERSGLPFKTLSSGYQATLDSLHALQQKIETADDILVAGAGPTGCETAAELATFYGKKKTIHLVINDTFVLPGLANSTRKAATQMLMSQGVHIIKNAKVEAVDGTTVKLSNGETINADVYLPTFGGKANSEFMPAEALDNDGFIKAKLTLQSQVSEAVWAVGDIVALEKKQATRIDPQVAHLAGNLDAVLRGKAKTAGALKEYAVDLGVMVFVSLGKNAGTGQVGGWRVWSWVVAMAKSRTLFVDNAEALVRGEKGIRAAI